LILGDREILMQNKNKEVKKDNQQYFEFYKNTIYDPVRFAEVDFFN
jgi:hypothetical protein